jgi:hypothetical protein
MSKVYDTIAEWNSLIQKRRLNKGKLIWRSFDGSTFQNNCLRRSASGPAAATTRGAGPSKAGACQPAAGLIKGWDHANKLNRHYDAVD